MLPDLTEILDAIWWRECWLELEADGDIDLPGFTGSTLRGALGSVMRPALCARGGACGEQCELPARCAFFSLFEQSRAAAGLGPNIPKPLILEPPCLEDLAAVAAGAPLGPPFTLLPGAPLPIIENNCRATLPSGAGLTLGLRVLGPASAALDGIVEGIRRHGLDVKGGRLRLARVHEAQGSLAFAARRAPAGPLRLHLLTPTIINLNGSSCFDPAVLARKIPEQAVVRAVKVFNALFAPSGRPIPFVEPRFPGLIFTGSRLFRYRLPRQSYRQERWMNFDGAVGWLEWEGETAPLLPWLRAAEILHLGQKATFGLGRVQLAD